MDQNEGGHDMAKDEKLTVQVERELVDRLGRAAFEADVTKSDLVRACIHLSLPLLRATPSLIHIVPTLPGDEHQKNAR